jgi:hypothetical protein
MTQTTRAGRADAFRRQARSIRDPSGVCLYRGEPRELFRENNSESSWALDLNPLGSDRELTSSGSTWG